MTSEEKPGRQKERKREQLIRSAFDQWMEDELRGSFANIRFRRVLSFDILFNNSNISKIIKEDSNDASDIAVEIAARHYYNECIDNPDFVCEFTFTDGTTIKDYFLPKKEDRVLVFTDEMQRKWQMAETPRTYEKPCPKSKKASYVKPCPKSKKPGFKAQETIDLTLSPENFRRPAPLPKKPVIHVQSGGNVPRSKTKIVYPTSNTIVDSEIFVPGMI